MKNLSCTALIVAAGNSTRMSALGNKQFLKISGTPVLARTIMAFDSASEINKIIIVTKPEFENAVSELCEKYSVTTPFSVVYGGETRQQSVWNGLCEIEYECLVAVHDGARPLISSQKINEAVSFAKENGSAVLGIPLSDTVKIVDVNDFIVSTPDRETLRLIQTPQIFPLSLLKTAYENAKAEGFTGTDDCSLAERVTKNIKYIFGDYSNIKITTPEDIIRAEAILKEEKPMRSGFGYDVHSLVEKRDLILGGVKIPFELGLDGHSDADVLIHALIDALLGAAALGDIGKLFPDTYQAYKNIDSRILLRKISALLSQNGYKIINCDMTVVAQAPKIAPYIEKMRENISSDLSIPLDSVSVKATTTERLGFEGRKEGISSYAICTIL